MIKCETNHSGTMSIQSGYKLYMHYDDFFTIRQRERSGNDFRSFTREFMC